VEFWRAREESTSFSARCYDTRFVSGLGYVHVVGRGRRGIVPLRLLESQDPSQQTTGPSSRELAPVAGFEPAPWH